MTKLLDTGDFSAGGGSAGALAGAMAASLVAMVARLSLKKDYGLSTSKYLKVARKGEALSINLLNGSTKDIKAFALVSKAYALPKSTGPEIKLRQEAIERAFSSAAAVPADNARYCVMVLDLSRQLSGKSNPAAASDLASADALARAGIECCILNIKANLPSIKTEDTRRELSRVIDEIEILLITQGEVK